MRKKREKGFWLKKRETFQTGKAAKSRAGVLRLNEHTSHVTVSKEDTQYIVNYSVAKWYIEAMEKAGVTL